MIARVIRQCHIPLDVALPTVLLQLVNAGRLLSLLPSVLQMDARFPRNRLISVHIKSVHFFLTFSSNKETPKQKGKRSTTGVPRMKVLILSGNTSSL